MSFRCRRCILSVVFGWLVLVLVPTSALSDMTLIDDFEDGSDDGWAHSSRSGKPSAYEVISGEYALKSNTRLVGPTGVSAYLDESTETPYANGFWRAKVRAESSSSNPILLLRVQDPELSRLWKFYGFVSSVSDSNFGIIKFNGQARSFPTALDQGVIPGFEANEDWILEAGAVGNQLSFKAWPANDTEPRFPQLMAIDSTFDTGGFAIDIGVAPGTSADQISGSFDDIYFQEPVEGDFDFDRLVTPLDIDALSDGIRSRSRNTNFDVTDDGVLDSADHQWWVQNIANAYYGDANLDGEFNTGDLVTVFKAGEYEDLHPGNSGWAEGDWNGDRDFDSGDLVAAFQDGGFERGRVAFQAIPEPHTVVMVFTALFAIPCVCPCRKKSSSRI